MVKSMMGGREFNFTREQIEQKMRGVEPEQIREHFVTINGVDYPPKQVITTMEPDWPRTSFTTMEAQRVLARVGLRSKRYTARGRARFGAEVIEAFGPNPAAVTSARPAESTDERLDRFEAALVVANQAIAALTARIERLESG